MSRQENALDRTADMWNKEMDHLGYISAWQRTHGLDKFLRLK